jgi:hypothetical protein
VAGAEGGALLGAAALGEFGGLGVDDELDDDEEQPATAARTISAAAVPAIPLRERSTLGNTARASNLIAPHAPLRPV